MGNLDELLTLANQNGRRLSKARVIEVVENCEKQRFALSADGTMIRANQGHSINVDLELKPVTPPAELYHGTVQKFLESIRHKGLINGNHQYVHLSRDRQTAIKVGSRRGKPIILTVNSGQMHADGILFYQAENGVWLTDHVPPSYLAEE